MTKRAYTLAGLLILFLCVPADLFGSSPESSADAGAPAFIEMRLSTHPKLQSLKLGDTLRGKVVRNVYFGDRLAIPRGSEASLKVSRLDLRQRGHSFVIPWPFRYLRHKYVKFPAFDFVDLTLPDGAKAHLRVSAFNAVDRLRVPEVAQKKTESDKGRTHASEGGIATKDGNDCLGQLLELVVNSGPLIITNTSSTDTARLISGQAGWSGIKTLEAGSRARLAINGTLSSSKNQAGDLFKAYLTEPLRLNSDLMLPEGTVFMGHVSKRIPARWLSRSGSLHLKFTRLVLPSGIELPVAASVTGLDVDRHSHLKLSPEGGLIGGSPGKARLLLELGLGAGITKAADDTYELIVELTASTATDASTAGTARLIGFAFSGLYWLTRRGREVTLPPYTTITVRFDRTPTFPQPFELPQPLKAKEK